MLNTCLSTAQIAALAFVVSFSFVSSLAAAEGPSSATSDNAASAPIQVPTGMPASASPPTNPSSMNDESSEPDVIRLPDRVVREEDKMILDSVPRLVRETESRREVFFYKVSQSYFFPLGGDQNELMERIERARRSREKIKLSIDKRTRTILGLAPN